LSALQVSHFLVLEVTGLLREQIQLVYTAL